MDHEIQLLHNDESGEGLTIIIKGKPQYVDKDVVVILGYSNTRDALIRHVDTEAKSCVVFFVTDSNYTFLRGSE